MDPNLLNELTAILKESHHFVLAQAPDAIQQYLTMGLVECVAWGLLFLIAGISMIVGGMAMIIRSRHSKYADSDFTLAGWFLIALAVLPVAGVVDYTVEALQIHYAPKAYLVQKLLVPHGKCGG